MERVYAFPRMIVADLNNLGCLCEDEYMSSKVALFELCTNKFK